MQNRKKAILKVLLFFGVAGLVVVNLFFYFKRDNTSGYTYTLKFRVKNNYYDNTLNTLNNWCRNGDKSNCDVVSYRNEDIYIIEYKLKSNEQLNADSITDVLKIKAVKEDYFNQYYDKMLLLDNLIALMDSTLLNNADQLKVTEKIDLSYKKLMLISTKHEFSKEFQILFPVEQSFSKPDLLSFHIKISVITIILFSFIGIVVIQIFKSDKN